MTTIGLVHAGRATRAIALIGAPDPTSVSGLTLWLDATDLTQGAGIVTAMNNKQGGTDPTISGGEEPSYNATNANYNNRPTWKCDAGGGTKVIRAAAAAHGLTTGPYTVVIVGQCSDSGIAMGTPSGNTVVSGGGGTGNKWQASSDASNYLASASGIANAPSVVVVVVNGASSKVYVSSHTPTLGTMGPAEDMTGVALKIGNYGAPASGLGQDADMTHFLLYTGAKSQVEVEYFLDTFGLESGIAIGG